jgi:hypothetical protein
VTINLPKLVAENIDRFTGRVWLLPELLRWWEQRTDERLFLLTGDPGTGKSMLLAWLAGFGPQPKDARAGEQLARLRAAAKAVHFCQAASRNTTPQALAESIANQLTSTVEGFGAALAATLADRVQIVGIAQAGTAAPGANLTGVAIAQIDLGTLGDELSFDRALTQPLKKLYETGHVEPTLLLVDALDEAETYTGATKIPDLLSRLSDLPSAVRILATSRDEPRVLKFFRHVKPVDLVRDAPRGEDDLRVYATQKLMVLSSVSDAKRRVFVDRLVKQAEGIFLYAAMLLDELLARPRDELPDLDIFPLPKGLSGLYHEFLIREAGKDDRRWFDLYEPLFGLIAVAQGEGLTAQRLTEIICKDIREALRASKQYLVGGSPTGPFRLFHKSFADFLLEEPDNEHFHINAAAIHKQITNHYCDIYHNDWRRCDEYGLRYLTAHLAEQSEYLKLVDLVCDPTYLEAKAESNLIFDLVEDLSTAIANLPRDDERSDVISALQTTLRYDIHFVQRHPTTLFQSVWNRVWGHMVEDTCSHYEDASPGDAQTSQGSLPPSLPLNRFLASWRAFKEKEEPDFFGYDT